MICHAGFTTFSFLQMFAVDNDLQRENIINIEHTAEGFNLYYWKE